MKKWLFVCLFLTLIGGAGVQAQNYSTGIGARLGLYSGVTVKHFVSERNALELIVSNRLRWLGARATVLYEWQSHPFYDQSWGFFFGFGGHVGRWSGRRGPQWWTDGQNHSEFGFDGIVGIEYLLESAPVSFSLDYKPYFTFGADHSGFTGDGVGLSIRYLIR